MSRIADIPGGFLPFDITKFRQGTYGAMGLCAICKKYEAVYMKYNHHWWSFCDRCKRARDRKIEKARCQ